MSGDKLPWMLTVTLVCRCDGSALISNLTSDRIRTEWPGPSVWRPGSSAPLRRRPEAHACPGTNGVAPSRACVHSGMSALHAYG